MVIYPSLHATFLLRFRALQNSVQLLLLLSLQPTAYWNFKGYLDFITRALSFVHNLHRISHPLLIYLIYPQNIHGRYCYYIGYQVK